MKKNELNSRKIESLNNKYGYLLSKKKNIKSDFY